MEGSHIIPPLGEGSHSVVYSNLPANHSSRFIICFYECLGEGRSLALFQS
jgi:hypothetical protein